MTSVVNLTYDELTDALETITALSALSTDTGAVVRQASLDMRTGRKATVIWSDNVSAYVLKEVI